MRPLAFLGDSGMSAVEGMLNAAQQSGFAGFFHNVPFLAAFLAFLVAQITKMFTNYYHQRVWDLSRIISSGGMPSSHTAFVVGLTAAVGVREGTSSSMFAMCLVLSLIVMYDATGVRHHAGRQATVLNLLVLDLPADHPIALEGRLKAELGHTPVQVLVGMLVGLGIGWLTQGLAMRNSK